MRTDREKGETGAGGKRSKITEERRTGDLFSLSKIGLSRALE